MAYEIKMKVNIDTSGNEKALKLIDEYQKKIKEANQIAAELASLDLCPEASIERQDDFDTTMRAD